MTEKELRRLSRVDLLEMLIALKKENEALHSELDSYAEQLNNRKIEVTEAGSIAEAALRLNGVFEAAQQAAAQYLENIQTLSANQEMYCQRMLEDTQRECQQMLAQTEEKCRAREQAMDAYRKAAVRDLNHLSVTKHTKKQ